MRAKAIQILENNRGIHQYLEFDNGFLDMTLQKGKIDKLDFTKILKLCSLKDITKKVKKNNPQNTRKCVQIIYLVSIQSV